jgi:hypothetical protein
MKTEYKRPVVVTLLYILAGVVAFLALFFTIIALGNGRAAGPIVFFVPAAVIYLIGYLFELLSRILHQTGRIREKLEGPVVVTAPDPVYYLLDNQKPTGPFPLKVLLNRLRMGTLLGSAQVQLAGSKTWVALETLDK